METALTVLIWTAIVLIALPGLFWTVLGILILVRIARS